MNSSCQRKNYTAEASLVTPGGRLKCLGQFYAKMTYKGKCYSYPGYVLPEKEAINLLAVTEMGLVKRVNEIINVSAGRKAVNREKLKTSEKRLKRRS